MCMPAEYHVDSLLHLAVDFQRTDLVTFMLGKNADVNALSHKGETLSEKLIRQIQETEARIKKEPDENNRRTEYKNKAVLGFM